MGHSILRSLLLRLLLCLNFPVRNHVSAQYIQTYVYQNRYSDGANIRLWRPKETDPWQLVIDTAPSAVFLEYNCHYMTAICRNARDFLSSDRGKKRLGRTDFTFDFSTSRKASAPKGRVNYRRHKSCPSNWVRNQGCPHVDQEPVWRNDGQWWTTALAPPPDGNRFIIAPRQRFDGLIENSGLQYTCDEFPAASWVEGGDGTGIVGNGYEGGPAAKRCAASRCNPKVKAEQNWQGTAHLLLKLELQSVIKDAGIWPPNVDKNKQVATFYFRMTNENNGVAARVLTYKSLNHDVPDNTRDVAQAKRHESISDFHRWADTVTIEELEALGKNRVKEHHAYANGTTFSPQDVGTKDDFFDFSGMKIVSNATGYASNMNGESSSLKRAAPNPIRKRKVASATPLVNNATISAVDKAREVVENAIEESSRLNDIRLALPLRNRYELKPGTVIGSRKTRRRREADVVPPVLHISEEIAAAAALISEVDARKETEGTVSSRAAVTGSFWMEHLDRKGTVPWGNDASYKVFRNVVDYGAVGDGVTDDTKAINDAMNDGKRCGEKCNGSTTKNAIVYFPPGKYRVSTTIEMPFGTQVIGDANNWPTIVAARNFIGLGVLSTDKYVGGGKGIDGLDQEWFVNTANFYRQIRNLRIDVTATRSSQQVACLHYQVAQATSIQNVELIATSGTGQRGIFAENGSGGVMSDITFTGGAFGIYGGNQQFTAQRLTFNGCDVGVQVIWDWGWVWKSISMKNVKTGFRLLQKDIVTKRDGSAGANGNIGSVSVIDSSFESVGTAVLIVPPNSKPGSGSTGVIIEHVSFQGVDKAVADTTGKTILAPSALVDHWALGPTYSSKGERSFSEGSKIAGFHKHGALLDSKGNYYERAKPQYEDHPVGDFIHVKDFGAKGDGVTDDTVAIQAALYASRGQILFIDAGSYIITSTVVVPLGSRIVGETWSQLVAAGKYFEDASDPKVMLKVGNDGDVGPIEMQDLIFTNRGPTAGLIMVEWNVRADRPGSAALWDCHARVGGATGTELTPKECPPSTSGTNQGCSAASLMMHITPKASGYFENMWLWVSDHMLDDPDLNDASNDMVQNSVYVARGLLIESQSPVWLYGTASEHCVFYQYNFNNAKTLFAGMIQTESPYYQPNPKPPAPFDAVVGNFPGDPTYKCSADSDELSGCDASWGVIIRGSENVFIAGAGIYSWFSTYSQDCIDLHACQKVLLLIEQNAENVRIQNLITIGTKYVAVQDGKGILAADNLNVDSHPKWSQITVFDVSRSKSGYQDMIWIDPKIWEMETPSFNCSVPCTVKIPPWTGATRVVDYPLITVSNEAWTSTITMAPLTMTNLIFEPVTIDSSNGKRQALEPFFPVPATTPAWPQVVYTGPDGKDTMTGPSIPFPTPPSSIGPGAAPPASGSWPKRWIVPVLGDETVPDVDRCSFDYPECYISPLKYGQAPFAPPVGPDHNGWEEVGDDWDGTDLDPTEVICPDIATTTSTTSTAAAPIKTPEPKPSPRVGDPMQNTRQCYNSGFHTTHIRLDNAIDSYCNHLRDQGRIFHAGYTHEENIPFNGDPLPLVVVIKLTVKAGCSWLNQPPLLETRDVSDNSTKMLEKRGQYGKELCSRYLHAIVDSCNCEGVDGKQGGMLFNDCYEWNLDPNFDW
ncbi:hypothetical protein E4U21_004434 [Claviceps maximensis]|nr:hypothetical protein E4U21_004434 [Claviceps maximensis]